MLSLTDQAMNDSDLDALADDLGWAIDIRGRTGRPLPSVSKIEAIGPGQILWHVEW